MSECAVCREAVGDGLDGLDACRACCAPSHLGCRLDLRGCPTPGCPGDESIRFSARSYPGWDEPLFPRPYLLSSALGLGMATLAVGCGWLAPSGSPTPVLYFAQMLGTPIFAYFATRTARDREGILPAALAPVASTVVLATLLTVIGITLPEPVIAPARFLVFALMPPWAGWWVGRTTSVRGRAPA